MNSDCHYIFIFYSDISGEGLADELTGTSKWLPWNELQWSTKQYRSIKLAIAIDYHKDGYTWAIMQATKDNRNRTKAKCHNMIGLNFITGSPQWFSGFYTIVYVVP